MGIRASGSRISRPSGGFGEQAGLVLTGVERLITELLAPRRFLILGDTNSSLGALAAKRMGVPVYHMEAGNRCFDNRVPEEVNRRVVDHGQGDVLLPSPPERSRQNLLAEGIRGDRVYVTGNPIREVIRHYEPQIAASRVLSTLKIDPKRFFLVTVHRAENVDVEERLRGVVAALNRLASDYGFPVVVSTHPRTRLRLQALGLGTTHETVRFLEPFGFFDFVSLEREAFCVLSDSGTVQEECAIFGVPNVTIRDGTG